MGFTRHLEQCHRAEAVLLLSRSAAVLAAAYVLTGRAPDAISLLEAVLGHARAVGLRLRGQ